MDRKTISKEEPTETEIALTIAATRLIINTKLLLRDYEHISAKHAEIPSPQMQSAIEKSVDDLVYSMTAKEALIAISYEFSNELRDSIIKA